MADLEIKGKDGKVVGKHKLAEAISGAQPVMSVLHRAVVAEEANSRQGTQSAKTRSETRGGGRKPYRQKKTGNARQGTIRAPHYAHGGMALAVKPRDYTKKLNKKERRAALAGALNAKIQAGDVTVVDQVVFTEPKTKLASQWLTSCGVADARRVLVILAEYDDTAYRSLRNIEGVVVRTAPARVVAEAAPAEEAKPKSKSKKAEAAPATGGGKSATFSTRDVLIAHKIVIAQAALQRIEEVWGS